MRALPRAVAWLTLATFLPLVDAQERDLQDAISLLDSSSFKTRERGADAIAHHYERALPALAALQKGLSDSHGTVRAACARAITAIGSGAAPALEELLKFVHDEDASVRSAILDALAALGIGNERVFEVLAEGFESLSGPEQAHVLRTLGHLGSGAAPILVAHLASESEPLRAAAVLALQDLGRDGAAALVTASRDAAPRVRVLVACCLERREHTASAVVTTLRALSKDDDLDVRVAATRSLGTFLNDVDGLVDDLIALAVSTDQDGTLRRVAIESLGRSSRRRKGIARALLPLLGQDSKDGLHDVVLAALDGLRCEEAKFRDGVFETLARRKATTEELVAALRALPRVSKTDEASAHALGAFLSHREAIVREAAVAALASFVEADANGVLPRLTKLCRDKDSSVRVATMKALAALQSRQSKVVPLLTARLRDDDPDVRAHAAFGLSQFDPGARTSLPAIVRLCDDDVPRVRQAAAFVGKELGDLAAMMIPKLFELAARDPDLETRIASLQALGGMAHRADRYVDEMASYLDDPHPRMRLAAAEALLRVDREARLERVQQTIAEGLKHPRAVVCRHALRCLALYGKPEKRSHDAVRAVFLHPSHEVRLSALEVLEDIQIVGEFENVVEALLLDPHVLVRARAAMTHAWVESKESAESIAKLLDDPSPMVREEAVRALGRMSAHAKSQYDRVVKLADGDPDAGVREAVLEVQATLR